MRIGRKGAPHYRIVSLGLRSVLGFWWLVGSHATLLSNTETERRARFINHYKSKD